MKIIGNGTNLDHLRFSHNGADLHFNCILQQSSSQIQERIERKNEAKIEFSDLHEVDSLIEMLKRFKEEATYGFIGNWKTDR